MVHNKLKKNLSWLLLAVIVISLGTLYLTRPKPDRNFKPKISPISVEVKKVEPESINARITSYGIVEPRVQSKVVAQVTGRVVRVAEQFRDGGFFQKGDLLLEIEKADYEIEVEIAQANLVEMVRALEEEKARADQARLDWERLGTKQKASPLVLRQPQLDAAKAMVASSKARLRKAKLNLDRCEIRAPFDGRVLSTSVDIGQVVVSNAVLAEIYATDAVEIRLPIKNRELGFLALPEASNLAQDRNQNALPSVDIISNLANEEVWKGTIVRTAGSIDSDSRQLYVVARIDDPFGSKAKNRFPLKIGQYITAVIDGKNIPNTIKVPNSAIFQGSYVYIFKQGSVYRREIGIAWQNERYAVIHKGLTPGEWLVLTPMGQVNSGTPVNVTNREAAGLPPSAKNSERSSKKSLGQAKAKGGRLE